MSLNTGPKDLDQQIEQLGKIVRHFASMASRYLLDADKDTNRANLTSMNAQE
jgi:hypothetical protein